ncbi:MAG: phage tail protein [Bacillota bacterium]|nr:phage tail protein [Bacillota bacterium]
MEYRMVNIETSRKKWSPGNRTDPFLAYNFLVEIEQIPVASFTDVSGLSIEAQVERKSFGGENDREYAFISQVKFSDITFKKGISNQNLLWNWYMQVIEGKIQRKNGSIYLLDPSGESVAAIWDFYNACPIKWEGPVFSASSNNVAVETLVFTHQGLSRSK